jgi:molybdopterin-binding protein
MISAGSQIDFGRIMANLFTVRQAADSLGVTYSTLKQWIYKGSVRTIRTEGGHHRVAQEEIDRLLAANRAPVRRKAGAAAGAAGVLVALSGRNQLRGIVDEVRIDGLLAQIRLRIGTQFLTAVITRDAVKELKLRSGDEAVAIIKSTEVMIGKGARSVTREGRNGWRGATRVRSTRNPRRFG